MTDAVGGYEKTSASALYLEVYGLVVGNHNGAHIEAVGRHGSEYEYVGLRVDDGATGTERVGRRSGWCGYKQAIGHVGGEAFAIYGSVDGKHRGAVVLRYSNLVEGIDGAVGCVACGEAQQAALAQEIASLVEKGEEVLHFIGRYVGQKAQSAGVDAYDGNARVAYAAGRLEEGAVAPQADGHIYFLADKVADDACRLEWEGLLLAEETVEVGVGIYLVGIVREYAQ